MKRYLSTPRSAATLRFGSTLGLIPILGLMLVFCPYSSADTYVVHPDGSGDFPTIQVAIDAVDDGDIIELTDGTFSGPGNRNISFQGKAITVRSQNGDPGTCIIDCHPGLNRGFVFDSAEGPQSVLADVTICHGHLTARGGGAYCNGSSPTIRHCIFSGNWSFYGGGGIGCVNASPAITDCVFSGNHAEWSGGGVHCEGSGSPTITNCDFYENSAEGGAGLASIDSTSPTVTDCAFSDNWVEGIGGSVLSGTSGTFTHCTFSGNQAAREGGAVKCSAFGCPAFDHCTFSGNSAPEGGAISLCSIAAQAATFTNCTFSGNAAQLGGGLLCGPYNTPPVLTNTIIAFSTSGEAFYCSGPSEPTLICCDLYGNAGGDWVGCIADQYGINGNICADPLFCDPGDEDFTLHANSPCAARVDLVYGVIGAWGVGCSTRGSEPQAAGRGARLCLASDGSNPFTESARIIYDVPGATASRVALNVYDATGRLVRALTAGPRPAGTYSTSWNGTDRSGNRVAAGTYFLRLSVGQQSVTRQLAFVR